MKSDNVPETEQPEFTPDQLNAVEEVIAGHRGRPGSLIPVLEEVQELLGYMPKSIQMKIATGLGVPPGEVFGVLTFYSFFTTVPRGRHTVRCCLGTACYVRGGRKILDSLTSELGVQPGETTADRRFSLETVRCLGACAMAPVMVAGKDTFGQMKPTKVAAVLEKLP